MKKYNFLLTLSLLIGVFFIFGCETYEYYEYSYTSNWESPYNVSLTDIKILTEEIEEFTENGTLYKKIPFTYPTTNVAGDKVTVSAIICIPSIMYTTSPHPKAKYLVLAHHGAMINNDEAPSKKTGSADCLPKFIGTNAIGVEADYIGFGKSVTQDQTFAYGDVNAKTSLQALICAKMWLESQGYTWENKLANVGFSQGGQTAMHAQKLVDTTSYGYLVKITKTFAGGGCYDLKITVDKSLDSGNSIYNPPKMPAVIWLGLETVRKLSGSDIQRSEIFKDTYISNIEALISRSYDFNNSMFASTAWTNSLQQDMLNEHSTLRARINQLVCNMNCNFIPKSTSKILLFSDSADDVVPTENSDALYEYFMNNGFSMTMRTSSSTDFSEDNVYIKYNTNTSNSGSSHTTAGTVFTTKVAAELTTW